MAPRALVHCLRQGPPDTGRWDGNTGPIEEWWSRTLEPELGIIQVHAVPAPQDLSDFERRLGLTIAIPGPPESLADNLTRL